MSSAGFEPAIPTKLPQTYALDRRDIQIDLNIVIYMGALKRSLPRP